MPDADNNWFNNWPDGLIGLDESNCIVELSPVARAIVGWSLEELQGKNAHDALCAINRSFQHTIEQCPLLNADRPGEIESTLWKHRNGHFVSIDFRIITVAYGKATHIISFVDNSTRLHNQAEMKKFSEYVEMSPAPLAEFVMDGQLLFGNTAMQELLLEYGFDDEGHSNAIPKNIGSIGERLKQSPSAYDTAEIKIDDHVFIWHFHILDNGEESTVVGYAFDITAQKEAEQIAVAQKAQARKEFYAKMVHELRTPLNAIIGFSDILLMRLEEKLGKKELHQLGLIKRAGVQLNELVTATLDITKIEAGKMSLEISGFRLSELCLEVKEQIQSLADEKKLNLRYTPLTERQIFSDKTKIRQILINLLSNAIKYTKEGEVLFSISEAHNEEIGDCVCITVSDTGIGIPEQQIPKLFLSFEQVDDAQTRDIEGTGLGLALVSNLVKLLGGIITVESTHGMGSTFEVQIPFMNNLQP